MKKYLLLSLLILANSTLSYGAVTGKLADYIVSSSGLKQILDKNGIYGTDAKQVLSYVDSSIYSFKNVKDQKVERDELLAVISKLPVTGKDATIRKELQVLLDKSDGNIKKEDVVTAINHLIYLANRYGKSVVITCAECVSDSLMKNGFKFTVENIKNAESAKILSELIPNNPKDLNTFISSRVKRLNLGDYSKVTTKIMLPSDEKTFALFLALLDSGNAEFKALGQSIVDLSTKNGKTNLFDPKDPNKLWRLVSTDMASGEAVKLTATLKEAGELAQKENLSAEVAFNRILKKKSEGSDELFAKFKSIKSKRCFFK